MQPSKSNTEAPQGELARVYASALQPYRGRLDFAGGLAEAQEATGLSDLGGETWSEAGFVTRLTALCSALESEAQLTAEGRSRARARLQIMLRTRLRVVAYRKQCGALSPVVAPLVGTGLPRSGTSFLQQLLARDPRNFSASTSEAMVPVPPPGVLATDAERTRVVADMLSFLGLDDPELNAVHPFAPEASDEDVVMQEGACGSLYQAFFNVPSYVPLVRATAADQYAWQKNVMQILQSARPSVRWVIKAPEHIAYWGVMWQTFPDARVFINHRDPARVIASMVSLFKTFQRVNSQQVIDHRMLGRYMLMGQMQAMQQVTAWRAAHPKVTVVDIHYRQLIADPIGEAERLYTAFGETLDSEAKQRMQAFLKVNRHGQSQGGVGHRYDLAEVGLSSELIEDTCGAYLDHFGIARERG